MAVLTGKHDYLFNNDLFLYGFGFGVFIVLAHFGKFKRFANMLKIVDCKGNYTGESKSEK